MSSRLVRMVDQDAVDKEQLLDHTFNDCDTWGEASVLPYVLVQRDISYRHTGEQIQSPVETIRRGYGDCEDQCVLLASLYDAIYSVTRFVLAENRAGDRHTCLEVDCEFDFQRDDHVGDLKQYYREVLGREIGSIHWRDETWFVADPVMGSYFGDISGIVQEGYIEGEYDNSWSWYRVLEVENVPPPMG